MAVYKTTYLYIVGMWCRPVTSNNNKVLVYTNYYAPRLCTRPVSAAGGIDRLPYERISYNVDGKIYDVMYFVRVDESSGVDVACSCSVSKLRIYKFAQ